MVLIFIFLILVFLLLELYFLKKKSKNVEKKTPEPFINNMENKEGYDYYLNGDMKIGNENGGPTNIGIGTEPDNNYYIKVNGKMTVNGKLTIGSVVFDYDLVNRINKLPLYTKDKYCLFESQNKDKKQCISRNELGMITGHRKIVFENAFGEKLTDLKLRHHGRHHRSEPGNNRGNNKWHEGIGYKDVRFKHNSEPYWNREYHHTLENKKSDTVDETNEFQLIPQKTPQIDLTDVYTSTIFNDGDVLNYNIQGNFLIFNPFRKLQVQFTGILNNKHYVNVTENKDLDEYINTNGNNVNEAFGFAFVCLKSVR